MKKIVVISFSCTLISLLIISAYSFTRVPKTGYVDLGKVYNEFEMKREKEAQLARIQQARKHILDSLELQLTSTSRVLQNLHKSSGKPAASEVNAFQRLQDEYVYKQQSFEQESMASIEKYEQEIWKQINQYVKDYGKANGYTYILGADGTGAVMHADESEDITEELTRYVNERYKGGSK